MKGGYKTDSAAKRGWIDCRPIARVVREWYDRQPRALESMMGWADTEYVSQVSPWDRLSLDSGVSKDLLFKIYGGKKSWIEFSAADRLITAINVHLWQEDSELREAYESFDFTHLDQRQPTLVAA